MVESSVEDIDMSPELAKFVSQIESSLWRKWDVRFGRNHYLYPDSTPYRLFQGFPNHVRRSEIRVYDPYLPLGGINGSRVCPAYGLGLFSRHPVYNGNSFFVFDTTILISWIIRIATDMLVGRFVPHAQENVLQPLHLYSHP